MLRLIGRYQLLTQLHRWAIHEWTFLSLACFLSLSILGLLARKWYIAQWIFLSKILWDGGDVPLLNVLVVDR